MSRLFGNMRQLAFVVQDIDAAMNYWNRQLGVGPFFIKRGLRFEPFVYKGESRASPQISIALANSGYMQIELIQQHDEVESIYRDFLQTHPQGLQHVAAWYDTQGMLEKKRQLVEKGLVPVQECVIPSSGVNLAYYATPESGQGLVFELADLLEEKHIQRITAIAQAAQDWQDDIGIIEVEK